MKRTCRSHGLFERNFCRIREGGSCVNGLLWELIMDKAIYRKSCYSLFFISPDISFSVYFVCEWRVRQSFCKIFCSPLFHRAQVELTIYLFFLNVSVKSKMTSIVELIHRAFMFAKSCTQIKDMLKLWCKWCKWNYSFNSWIIFRILLFLRLIYSPGTVHVLHDANMSIYITKLSASYYRSENNSCCKTINFRVVPYYRNFHHFYVFPWKWLYKMPQSTKNILKSLWPSVQKHCNVNFY